VGNKTIEITDANFDEVISNNPKVVIDCWAAWCAPCRMLTPVIEELAEERPDIVFAKLNVDQNRNTPLKYGIMSIPTLLYFKNGELVEKTLGALPKNILQNRLEKLN
jgi:thioredoxin 1